MCFVFSFQLSSQNRKVLTSDLGEQRQGLFLHFRHGAEPHSTFARLRNEHAGLGSAVQRSFTGGSLQRAGASAARTWELSHGRRFPQDHCRRSSLAGCVASTAQRHFSSRQMLLHLVSPRAERGPGGWPPHTPGLQCSGRARGEGC